MLAFGSVINSKQGVAVANELKQYEILDISAADCSYDAIQFCERFIRSGPRYVFGCNDWAASIAEQLEIDGFIDDISRQRVFCSKPVFRSTEVPRGALVVSAVVLGRPLTALSRIKDQGLVGLDYFSFRKYSGLPLKDVIFLDSFKLDFSSNRRHYDSLLASLKDEESRRIFTRLVNFRLTSDLAFMEGFVDAQVRQYFEPFLQLQPVGESFIDVGCYDGFTTLEFIKRCPDYREIHIFEPDESNMRTVKSRLKQYCNVHFHDYGASDRSETRRFTSAGSASFVSADGQCVIDVKPIDDVVANPYSFLKMDIEGGELAALHGASCSIAEFKPKLAISAYHKPDDLWKIHQKVMGLYSGYDVYLRHYTEGVTETVLFFVPSPA